LGGWEISKAKRMTWNCGCVWDIEVGFPEGSQLEYKYLVMHEDTHEIKWESGKNRELWIEPDNLMVVDTWDSGSAAQ